MEFTCLGWEGSPGGVVREQPFGDEGFHGAVFVVLPQTAAHFQVRTAERLNVLGLATQVAVDGPGLAWPHGLRATFFHLSPCEHRLVNAHLTSHVDPFPYRASC